LKEIAKMKHSKLLLAAALSAAAWCGASQAQSVVYGVEYYGTSTGTTPSESAWVVYPSEPAYLGYAVTGQRDYYGRWKQKSEPVAVIGTQRTYVYPETTLYPDTTRLVYPSSEVIYTTPFDYTLTPRY
jgi:hypothetical protein